MNYFTHGLLFDDAIFIVFVIAFDFVFAIVSIVGCSENVFVFAIVSIVGCSENVFVFVCLWPCLVSSFNDTLIKFLKCHKYLCKVLQIPGFSTI